MPDRERPNMFSFELPPDLREGLEALRERDGAAVAVSIRRAIETWLELKGIRQKGGTKKTKARK
jgi:predicted DNA-binding protein